MEPFLTNKGVKSGNECFIHCVVEKFSGIKSTSVSDQGNTHLPKAMHIVVEKYSLQLSVKEFKKCFEHFVPLYFQK